MGRSLMKRIALGHWNKELSVSRTVRLIPKCPADARTIGLCGIWHRYTVMLSDGDTKTFNHLKALNIYGDDHPLTKEECVNHVAKRMGTALRKLRTDSSKQGVKLGGYGHGKLREPTINKLTTYYGKAIRDNVGDAEAMARAVNATLLHASSTNEHPQHHLCPDGEESWYFFKRGNGIEHNKDTMKTVLNADVAEALKPVYARLSSPALMKACVRGKTQNANEDSIPEYGHSVQKGVVLKLG